MKLLSRIFKGRRAADASSEKEARNKYERLPRHSVILFAVAGISVVLYIIMRLSTSFSEFFNMHIASIIRAALAHLTNLYPLSLAETLLILLPVIAFFLVRISVKHYCYSWRGVAIFTARLLSYASLFLTLFVLTFASGYNSVPVSDKLGLEQREVSAEELYDTAIILADRVKGELDSIYFSYSGASEMGYSWKEMNQKLLEAYSEFSSANKGIVQNLRSRAKPIMLSDALSYTHTTGIYSFFTGEANFNNVFPDYTVPYTVAHELAHQRGISKEDEANFVAFLVCEKSTDPFVRYSGYISMLEYVMHALAKADRDLYRDLYYSLDDRIIGEFKSYSEFFDKYRDNVVADISGALNEGGIKFHGSRSYGMVVDLAVAYFKTTD